jgi:hypothetical protein
MGMQHLTGACLCGAVTYHVDGGPRFNAYACHCTDCQRRSGSAFGIQLAVMETALTVAGATISGTHVQPSGAVAGIVACAACLTRLYTTNDRRPGIVNLRAGTIDGAAHIAPVAHMWVTQKHDWIVIPEAAQSFATQPESPEAWAAVLMGTNL